LKIPIKIIKVDTGTEMKTVITFHSSDYFALAEGSTEKIKEFENLYSDVIEKINKIKGEKYDTLSSSKYYELGIILKNFNQKVDSGFEIKNYNASISRDFDLSKDYIYDLISIAEIFKKSEILDSIPFSYYRALKRKRNELESLGLFEEEKKRLNQMGKDGALLGRERYKLELNKIINSKKVK
jgi:hypothetical protein